MTSPLPLEVNGLGRSAASSGFREMKWRSLQRVSETHIWFLPECWGVFLFLFWLSLEEMYSVGGKGLIHCLNNIKTFMLSVSDRNET